jgi:hypothetical protein
MFTPPNYGTPLAGLPSDSPILGLLIAGTLMVGVGFVMWLSRKVGRFFGHHEGLDTSRHPLAERRAMRESSHQMDAIYARDAAWRDEHPAEAKAKDAAYTDHLAAENRQHAEQVAGGGDLNGGSFLDGLSGSSGGASTGSHASGDSNFSGDGGHFGGGGASGEF